VEVLGWGWVAYVLRTTGVAGWIFFFETGDLLEGERGDAGVVAFVCLVLGGGVSIAGLYCGRTGGSAVGKQVGSRP